MKTRNLLRLPIVLAALVATPLFSAHATENDRDNRGDRDRNERRDREYEVRCSFDSGEQEQGGDCWASIQFCGDRDHGRGGDDRGGPGLVTAELDFRCREEMVVRCGRRTLFEGDFEVKHRRDEVIVKGETNGRHRKSPTITYEDSDRRHSRFVDASLRLDGLERYGTCEIDRDDHDRHDRDDDHGRGGNDRGGNDRGGNDRGGNDRGGNDRGGNDRGGDDRGGDDRGGNDRGGNDRGGNDRGGGRGGGRG